ncbi:MAG TPA: sugar ABC transporter permease [Methylomirabilota bacterium]|nr:sugar ABC transporter permease [Methylomirabilota bacterium]
MARGQGRRYKWTILPVVAVPVLFLAAPIIFFQIYFSLHQWTAYLGDWWEAEFVGLENFADVLGDERFHWSLVRSLIFAGASTVLCLLIGFTLAYLMREPFRGRGLFYLLFITPMLIVPIAIGYNFEMLLVEKGPLNQMLGWITGQEIRVSWFAQPIPAFLSIIFIEVWNWTPFVFILMLAGLSGMPREPIEAARVLGASPLQIFFQIQLPLLRPVIVLALILRFLEALGEYPKVWALTRGGPGSYTETMPVYLYITSWQHFNISKAAAMSYLVLIIVAAIVYLCIRILLREKRALEALYRPSS